MVTAWFRGYQVEHFVQFIARDAHGFGLRCCLCEQLFDMAELIFAQEFLVALGDKTALALHSADKAELLQVGVGALGGDDTHAKIARECTDAGEFGSRSKRARKDLSFDLRGYLLVDGLVARIG